MPPQIYMPEIFWHDRTALLAIDICQTDGIQNLSATGIGAEDFTAKTYKMATVSVQKEVRIWNFSFCKVELPTQLKKRQNEIPKTTAINSSAYEVDPDSYCYSLAVNFLANLAGHNSTTNVVRFSPNGRFLASGDANGGLYIWALQDDVQVAQETPQPPNDDIVVITATMEDDEIQIIANNSDKENNDQQNEIQTQLARSNSNLSGSRNITRPNQNANRDENDPVLDDIPPNKETWTRQCVIRHMQDVNFVCFSPDGLRIASVSRDDSLAVHIVETGKKVWKVDHFRFFPNGVVWHPSGKYIATMSTDRRMDVVDAQKGTRLRSLHSVELPEIEMPISNDPPICMKQKLYRVFHDDQLNSFVRGADFSPCGELLFAPAVHLEISANNFYGTFVFNSQDLGLCRPTALLPSVKPTIMVKCCPVCFELKSPTNDNFLKLPYRLIFAVMGKESILLYSSQQQRPFAYFDNLQLDSLTCMSWTPDGRVLVISSQEGYNTFITMDDEAFGKPCNPKPAVVDPGLLSINRVQTPGTPNAMLQATPKRLNTTEKKNRKKTAESVAQTNNSQPADEVKKPTGKPLPTTIEVRRKPKNQITNKNNRKEVEVVTIET